MSAIVLQLSSLIPGRLYGVLEHATFEPAIALAWDMWIACILQHMYSGFYHNFSNLVSECISSTLIQRLVSVFQPSTCSAQAAELEPVH